MGYDLHVHTTASDGIVPPADVVRRGVELKLEGIAITDHDTVDGIISALEYIDKEGVEFDLIPGIELSIDFDLEEVHLLGYFIDYRNPQLLEKLILFRDARTQRAVKMVEKLNQMGLRVDYDRVREIAVGGLIGRPHVAQVLMEKGYVRTIKEAFEKYLGRGRSAYFPRYKLLPRESIKLIKECGGISILAHPGHIKDQRLVDEMICLGINGIEVFYPEHSEQQTSYYRELSQAKGLLITGGSDFHGESAERNEMGAVRIERRYVEDMKSFLNRS
ncbi:MAG: PHP domain-containing protein [Syntrophomonadaceae bacterium]|nr:PHP domain-containing protein [Syntrophomonadaceae bacterium]